MSTQLKVRELLSGPDKWTQGWSARLADGRECNSTMDGAVCWCLGGAIRYCHENPGEVYHRACEHLGVYALEVWNDAPERTFEDIRKLAEELDI